MAWMLQVYYCAVNILITSCFLDVSAYVFDRYLFEG